MSEITTIGLEAAGEQFEESGVGTRRRQPDSNAGSTLDDAGGDFRQQAQAQGVELHPCCG